MSAPKNGSSIVIKLFESPLARGINELEGRIQQWLEMNSEIDIHSTGIEVSGDRYIVSLFFSFHQDSADELERREGGAVGQGSATAVAGNSVFRKAPSAEGGGGDRVSIPPRRPTPVANPVHTRPSLTAGILFDED